jgi:beta-phosphoglucomutase-like phosphatase (HAD superfamily)
MTTTSSSAPAPAASAAPAVELVVLDMAGTTVVDDGIVEQAFARTADRVDLGPTLTRDEALQHVRDTMGQSKIDVFRHLAGGDEQVACPLDRLDALGWQVDAALSPVDAGRGRPAPDLVLTALLRTGASSVASVVVVGDTASDVLSGRAAGAGLVVGVTTGAHTRDQLLAAGADVVLDSVRELTGLPQFAGITAATTAVPVS